MKKNLLAIIIFINAFTMAYSQCTVPTSLLITGPSTISICEGTAHTLSGVVTVPGASQNGGFTYTWLKAGTAITTQASIILTENVATNIPAYAGISGMMADAGTYVLRVEDGNVGNAACFTEASIVLTVNPKPVITSAATGMACSGVAQNYSITSNITSSYKWTRAAVTGISNSGSFNQSLSPITETLTNTTASPAVVRYIITPTSTSGCVGTTFNYDVTVNPKPAVTSAATGTICSGVAQNYSITSYIASSYTWTRAVVAGITNSAGSGTDNSITEALTNTTSSPVVVRYKITPTSTIGSCVGTPFNYDVTVTPYLIPNVTITTPSTTICAGTSVTFTAITDNGGTPTYSWQKNGVTIMPAATNSTYTTTGAQNGDSYYVHMLSNETCAITFPVTSNAIVMTVTTVVTPAVTITASPAEAICTGTNVTFTASPDNGGTAPTYEWSIGGASQGATSITSSTFTSTTLNNGDQVTVKMTSTSGCAIAPGTATSNTITMTVAPVLTPAVSISANPTTICTNGYTTFTATPSNGGTAPLYEWSINAVSQGIPTSSSSFTTTALTSSFDQVSVRLISNSPCASPLTASASMSITVNSGIDAGIIGSDQTICYNSIPAPITEITAPTGIVGTPTYTWEAAVMASGPFSAIPTASSPNFTPTVPITQDVYIRRITTDPSSPAPCNTATSNTIHITVRPQLVAGVIASDQTICSGTVPTAITQTTTPTGGTGTFTYQWQSDVSGSFQDIVGATSSSYTPPALTATTRFQRVDRSGTCGTVTSNVVTKTVTAPEVLTASINDPGQVCAGSSPITFTATATTTGTGTLSYSWSLGSVTVGTNSPTYTYNPVAAGDNGKVIKVVVTTSNGCNAGPATSNVVTLDIVNSTTPTVSISTNNNPQCIGLPTTFTATSTGVGSTPSYQWSVIPQGSGVPVAVGTGTNTFSSTSLSNGDQVYVELTSSLGCLIGSNPFVSNRISMVIKPIPAPAIIEGDQTICSPNSFTFNGLITAVNTYEWRQLPTNTVVSTGSAFTATQSGSYYIYEDNGTCNSSSEPITLTVDPCGAFSTSITGPNPITPGQQNAVYSVTNQTGFTYTWSITGGTIVSGQNTNSVTVDWNAPTANAFARTTATTYSISVLEKNPTNQLKTTTLNINTITTGTTLSQTQSGINVFPNPTTGSFNIEMPESGVAVSYDILDLTGRLVGSGTFTSTTSGNQKIDADLDAGMYQVVLKYNNVVACVRLSKVQ